MIGTFFKRELLLVIRFVALQQLFRDVSTYEFRLSIFIYAETSDVSVVDWRKVAWNSLFDIFELRERDNFGIMHLWLNPISSCWRLNFLFWEATDFNCFGLAGPEHATFGVFTHLVIANIIVQWIFGTILVEHRMPLRF